MNQPLTPEQKLSGKFPMRIPRPLHANLIRLAKAEGVSLNQLVSCILAAKIAVAEVTPRRRGCGCQL